MNFQVLESGHYRAHDPAHDVWFEVNHLRRDRQELHGELTVLTSLTGARVIDGALSRGAFNFSSRRTAQELSKYLADRARTGDKLDWTGLVEEFRYRVIDAENKGQPAVLLHEVPRPAPDAFHDVYGWRLPLRHPAIAFGDGGTGKSLLALYYAGTLAQRGENVGYFDWELSADEHRERLEALFGADMPAIRYVRCLRPLTAEADHLRRVVREHSLTFGVFDSVAPACDGPPEAAEVASAYFRAVRQLGDQFGSLHLAHVSRAEGADQKPFGSAFWHNLARSTWFLKAGDDTPSGRTVALYHRKSNLSRLFSPIGFDLCFERDTITICRIALADVEEFASTIPLWQRVRSELGSGARKVHELAALLDAKPDTVEKALKRHKNTFVRIDGNPDGVARWGLLLTRDAA